MHLTAEARLKGILYGTDIGTWEWNLESGEMILNDRWASMLGYSLKELAPVGLHTLKDLCHEADFHTTHQLLERYVEGAAPRFDSVVRMRHKSGGWRYIHTRGKLFRTEGGRRWLMGTHLDITEERTRERQLKQLSESLPGVIYTFVLKTDGHYYFQYLSRKTEEFYGIPMEQALADADCIFRLIHPEDQKRVRTSIDQSARTLQQWSCDYRIVINNRTHWVRGLSRPEKDPDGTVTWHGLITNIDEEKELQQKLEYLSVTDELTGLYNRRHFLQKLDEFTNASERYGTTFSLMSLDIDFFKNINDSWGHPMGDEVLRQIARLIRERTRKSDIIARTGGEEFIVLMPSTSLDNARHLAQTLRGAIEKEVFVARDGTRFHTTISAGVVCWSRSLATVEDLLSVCDQSLYAAKRAGRNRVVVSDVPGTPH